MPNNRSACTTHSASLDKAVFSGCLAESGLVDARLTLTKPSPNMKAPALFRTLSTGVNNRPRHRQTGSLHRRIDPVNVFVVVQGVEKTNNFLVRRLVQVGEVLCQVAYFRRRHIPTRQLQSLGDMV